MIEKLVYAAVGMAITYYAIDYYFSTKKTHKKSEDEDENPEFDMYQMEYTLEELAHKLWLRNEVKLISNEPSSEEIAVAVAQCPEFFHSKTIDFWNDTIARNYKWLLLEEDRGQLGLISAIKALMLYLDEEQHANLSSVSSYYGRIGSTGKDKENDTECAIFKQKGTYETYSKISILDHTLGVVDQVINVVKGGKKHYIWLGNLGDGIIAALGHDLGKIKRQLDSNEKDSHEKLSPSVFEEIVGDMLPEKKITEIKRAISLHHTQLQDGNAEPLAYKLIMADHQRRVVELKKYNEEEGSTKETPQDKHEATLDGTVEKIKKEILRLLTIPENDYKYVVYDKSESAYLYIYTSKMLSFAKENEIGDDLYIAALKRLRADKIIAIVDFNKYTGYKAKLKLQNVVEPIKAEFLPVDYKKLSLELSDIHNTFGQFDMPEIILSSHVLAGGKK